MIRLEIDPSCHETEVIIRTAQQTEITDHLINTVRRITADELPPVEAYQRGSLVLLDQQEIIRVFTENRKLIISSESGRYETRQPLKELEKRLDRDRFVRISRFEIMNLRKVAGFDFSNTGTIRVAFRDGSETWVARRYVQSIQNELKRYRAQKGGEHGHD